LNFLADVRIAEFFDTFDTVSLKSEVPSVLASNLGDFGGVLLPMPMEDLCEYDGEDGTETETLVDLILVLKLKYFELMRLLDFDFDGF
jgi:hypothetical protein